MADARPRNLGASAYQRLLNRYGGSAEPFELVLVRYAIERLLYRLSVSKYADRFVLKGALLFHVWGYENPRPTRDADLLGAGMNDPQHLLGVFREICGLPAEDGTLYELDGIRAEAIAEDKVYVGVRVSLWARLHNARIPVQVDIGFGDAITPNPEAVLYPTLLDFPAPRLRAYPVYTLVAEKFHAMVALGARNSRMRDFWDIWAIGRHEKLDANTLAQAIAATFARRQTACPPELPLALTEEFLSIPGKQEQWNAFLRRSRLSDDHLSLAQAQAVIAALIGPVLAALRRGTA